MFLPSYVSVILYYLGERNGFECDPNQGAHGRMNVVMSKLKYLTEGNGFCIKCNELYLNI